MEDKNNLTIFKILNMKENDVKYEMEKAMSRRYNRKVELSKVVWEKVVLDTQRDIEVNKHEFNVEPSNKYVERVLLQVTDIHFRYS